MLSTETTDPPQLVYNFERTLRPQDVNYGHAGEELSRYAETWHRLGDTATDFVEGMVESHRTPNGLELSIVPPEDAPDDAEKLVRQAGLMLYYARNVFPDEFTATLRQINVDTQAPDITPELIMNFIKARADKINAVEDEMQPEVERWKSEFIHALEWAHKHGLDVDIDRAKKRVDDVQVIWFDRLLQSHNSSAVGSYVQIGSVVELGLPTADDGDTYNPRKTFFHELLHTCAGVRTVSAMGGRNVRVTRNGLRPMRTAATAKSKNINVWLNEAVTESLARILANIQPDQEIDFQNLTADQFSNLLNETGRPTSYLFEQSTLNSLLDVIPQDKQVVPLLINAYFEDYDVDKMRTTGSRQPYHKQLFKLLNMYGPMAEYDALYRDGGSISLATIVLRESMRDYLDEKEVIQPPTRQDVMQERYKSRAHKSARRRTARHVKRYHRHHPNSLSRSKN